MCLGRLRMGSRSPSGACLAGLGVPSGCSTRCMIGRVEVGRPPFAYEWSPGGSRAAGRSSRVWERWAREYPRWPEARTVAHYHRTWGAALLVAGLAGGREPLDLSLNERVEAARRMAAAGFSAAQIGEEVGVCGGTVGRYLGAHTCRCGRNWVVRATRCGQCAREQAALSAPPRWERAGVIEALKRWGELEGCAPRASSGWVGGTHAGAGRGSTRRGRRPRRS